MGFTCDNKKIIIKYKIEVIKTEQDKAEGMSESI